MINYRIAYERFVREAKKKNIANGIVDKAALSIVEGETHHIMPTILGGSNNFKNLVKLSHLNHAYAHLLLNLAMLQEKNYEDLKKLGYALNPCDGFCEMFRSKHALRRLKVDVYVSGKNYPPLTMSMVNAAKYFCFACRMNPNNKLMTNGMLYKIIHAATFSQSKYGYKIVFHDI